MVMSLIVGAPRVHAGGELSELDDGRLVEEAVVERVVRLADHAALRQPVADDQVGLAEAVGVELLLVVGVGAHGGDVQAAVQPLRLDDTVRARASS